MCKIRNPKFKPSSNKKTNPYPVKIRKTIMDFVEGYTTEPKILLSKPG